MSETKPPQEIITEFLNQMATQDRRGTASPFYYTIRTKKKEYRPSGYGDETVFRCDDNEYESETAAARALFANGCSKSAVREYLKEGEEFTIEWVWVNQGVFFTETDATNHLIRNRHHYSKDAHTYVDHAWRAPELTEFIQALFKHFNIEVKNI